MYPAKKCKAVLLLLLHVAVAVDGFVPISTGGVGLIGAKRDHHVVTGTTIPEAAKMYKRTSLHLSNSGFPWEAPVPAQSGEEETLLRLHLSIANGVDKEEALDKVQHYTQSFPFAAVLPVQPLQYLPTLDGGVDVLFLRKKTKEKGSVDGGIRFFVQADETGEGIEVLAKRNSKGQTVSKAFTEKLVVQAYVKGISGQDDERTGVSPTDKVSVESVFHKWM